MAEREQKKKQAPTKSDEVVEEVLTIVTTVLDAADGHS